MQTIQPLHHNLVRSSNRYNAWNFDKGAPGTLSVEELVGVPDQFELSNNYPNPFNPTTSINFNVPIASEVILTIYNITGQEVAKFITDTRNQALIKQLEWKDHGE